MVAIRDTKTFTLSKEELFEILGSHFESSGKMDKKEFSPDSMVTFPHNPDHFLTVEYYKCQN